MCHFIYIYSVFFKQIPIFPFWKIALCRDCTFLHPHQQCTGALISPQPKQGVIIIDSFYWWIDFLKKKIPQCNLHLHFTYIEYSWLSFHVLRTIYLFSFLWIFYELFPFPVIFLMWEMYPLEKLFVL